MKRCMTRRHAFTASAALALAAVAAGGPAWGEADLSSPLGLWKTVDDKTGEERGIVRVMESNGLIYGRIEKVLDPRAIGKICEKCTDDRRGKPIQGLEVIRGLKPDGDLHWSGGEILDPETGDTYRVSMTLTDGGQKLDVRGSILGGLIGRSQTWLRDNR